jgi:hypothetical protein
VTTPTFDSLFDAVEGLVEVTGRLVERDHLLDQHRNDKGERPALASCPSDPCQTWRPFAVRWDMFNGRRLP